MPYEIKAIPSEVVHLKTLKEGDNSVIFQVRFQEKLCVMKVYHNRGPSKFDPPDYEVDLFICESTAYDRMQSKGLCKKGVIPDFYGVIKNIQPAAWPILEMFCNDELLPNAILIEYIPDLQPIDLTNFSEERLTKLRNILDDIHKANVLHGDPMPRNMMVSVGEQDRILWVDFDSAQTFPESNHSPKHEQWIKEEVEMVDYFVDALAQDFKEGRLSRTISYYYDYFP